MNTVNFLSKETNAAQEKFKKLLLKDLTALVGKCFWDHENDPESDDPPSDEFIMIESVDENGSLIGTTVDFYDDSVAVCTDSPIEIITGQPVAKTEFQNALIRANKLIAEKIDSLIAS